MFSLSTVCNTYCTKHQTIHVFLDFSERPSNESTAWLALISLIPLVEVSVTTLDIDASILAFLDVISDISCSNSDLHSLFFSLWFSPRASWISSPICNYRLALSLLYGKVPVQSLSCSSWAPVVGHPMLPAGYCLLTLDVFLKVSRQSVGT